MLYHFLISSTGLIGFHISSVFGGYPRGNIAGRLQLTVSFRLSGVQHQDYFFLPVAWYGFHPIISLLPINCSFVSIWVNTEYIRKCIRYRIPFPATPSNHRVHHGSQENILTKTMEQPYHGDRISVLTGRRRTGSIWKKRIISKQKAKPALLHFHEYIDIWNDMKNARGFQKKMFFLLAILLILRNSKIRNWRKWEKSCTRSITNSPQKQIAWSCEDLTDLFNSVSSHTILLVLSSNLRVVLLLDPTRTDYPVTRINHDNAFAQVYDSLFAIIFNAIIFSLFRCDCSSAKKPWGKSSARVIRNTLI